MRGRIAAAFGLSDARAEEMVPIHVMTTTGDRFLAGPLKDIGGKGLFTKELEEALLGGEIDFAVHSMKDVPTLLPEGLAIMAILPREDPRDGFVSPVAERIADLPRGAVVGSASLRRGAQIRALRPDVHVITFRGNVNTRLDKVARGEVHATILALAGLRRLGLAEKARLIPPEDMLPAVAQGAIGIEMRIGDPLVEIVALALDHRPSHLAVSLERGFLAALDGSCRTPIAGHAAPDGEGYLLDGAIYLPDGSEHHAISQACAPADAAQADAMGRALGEALKVEAGPAFLDRLAAMG